MTLEFLKYQGTGNDFILIDNRHDNFDKNDTKKIAFLCHRRFGIGADGLILLEESSEENVDFVMTYFNSDGNLSTMCGNGGRCITAFAKRLGIIDHEAIFRAVDGLHEAKIENGKVELKMQDVSRIKRLEDHLFVDTGSPHVVLFRDKIDSINVYENGKAIRNSPAYIAKGTNVNFVEMVNGNTMKVRTFERGVEAETLSCGTGVTAAAIGAYFTHQTKSTEIDVQTPGGELSVRFKQVGNIFSDVWLTGPATMVFKGIYE